MECGKFKKPRLGFEIVTSKVILLVTTVKTMQDKGYRYQEHRLSFLRKNINRMLFPLGDGRNDEEQESDLD